MEKEILENITQRLDPLEKIVAEMNQKLASVVDEVATDVPMGPEARAKMRGAEALRNNKRDAHVTEKILNEVINNQSGFQTISVPDSLVWDSIRLIERHSLNSVDAMVLRSALDTAIELRSTGDRLVLVASDQRLLRAARAEGLQIFNPELDSQQRLTDWID